MAGASDDASSLAAHDLALRHLSERGFIQFHPALGKSLGHKAAIFLGLALYWTRHGAQHHPHRQGWFFMSAREWTESTGLSGREQVTARSTLLLAGLLEEALAGKPPVMHFRVRLSALAGMLGVGGTGELPAWDVVATWFRHCVSFYKPLADVAGSVAGGLYLSYLLQHQRRSIQSQQLHNGCMRVSQDEVSAALCLGAKVQRNARERLRRAGLLQETGAGLIRLNLTAISACLQAQGGRMLPTKTARGTRAPVLRLAATEHPTRNAAPRATSAPASQGKAHELAPMLTPAKQRPLMLLSPLMPAAGNSGHESAPGLSSMSLRLDSIRRMLGVQVAGIEGHAGIPHEPVAPRFAFGIGNPLVDHGRAIAVTREITSETAENAKLGPVDNLAQRLQESAENAKSEAQESAESAESNLPKTQSLIQRELQITTTTARERRRATRSVDNSNGGEGDSRRRRMTASQQNEAAARDLSAVAAQGLVYPSSLNPSLLPGLQYVLLGVPAHKRQELLDELEGQLRIPSKVIHNPAGWMQGVVRRQQRGGVVLALAAKVAADRVQREQTEQQVMRAYSTGSNMQRDPAMKVPPDQHIVISDVAKEHLAQLQAQRATYITKGRQ